MLCAEISTTLRNDILWTLEVQSNSSQINPRQLGHWVTNNNFYLNITMRVEQVQLNNSKRFIFLQGNNSPLQVATMYSFPPWSLRTAVSTLAIKSSSSSSPSPGLFSRKCVYHNLHCHSCPRIDWHAQHKLVLLIYSFWQTRIEPFFRTLEESTQISTTESQIHSHLRSRYITKPMQFTKTIINLGLAHPLQTQ